jgi:hypothetical protein
VRIRDEKPTESFVEVHVVPVCGLPGAYTKSLGIEKNEIINNNIMRQSGRKK